MNLTQNTLHYHVQNNESGSYTGNLLLSPVPLLSTGHIVLVPDVDAYDNPIYRTNSPQDGKFYRIVYEINKWLLYVSTDDGAGWYHEGLFPVSQECAQTTNPWEISWTNGYTVTRQIA